MCKKLIYLVSFVLVLAIPALASQTIVYDTTWNPMPPQHANLPDEWDLVSGLPTYPGAPGPFGGGTAGFNDILDYYYGSWTRIDDDNDQLWFDLDGSALVKAIYTSSSLKLGYSTNEDMGSSITWIGGGGGGDLDSVGEMGSFDIIPNSDAFIWVIGGSVTKSSNPAVFNDGMDNMVTYRITEFLGGSVPTSPTYVIAFEGGSPGDMDYQDFVVEVSNVGLIHEPGAILLSYASNPYPADGALYQDTWVDLSWRAGEFAVSHDIYFGTNFNNVNRGTGGTFMGNQTRTQLRVGTPGFPYPDGLIPGTTYYWRIDEINPQYSNSPWKGDVWSFTVSRVSEGWTYDGGILVGAYYYPWYGPTAHRVSQSLRQHLVPRQTAELGEYDSSSYEVVTKHIEYSHRANIHFWLCSWWGPGTNEDNVFRYNILPHPYAGELRYAILYESAGRLGSFSNPDYTNLLDDFEYFADNFFSNPNYLKINGRPVVFIYLTRVYFRNPLGYDALSDLRAAFPNLYIIADDIFGQNYSSSYARKWDAVTAYDLYGQTLRSLGSTKAALDELRRIMSQAKTAANSEGVGLIPFATPGFNKRVLVDSINGAPRYFEDDPTSVEGDLFRAMLRDVVVPKVDPLAENILLVTSFNEWHEDTQIEPTMGTGGTTNVDDSASGNHYTQGDYYTDYGYLYLDILCEETTVLPLDPLSDALDTTLSFTTGGEEDWFGQTATYYHDGDAAQSGSITHDQDSWLQTSVNGAGTVSFYWKVSSEESCDYLEFYIDGGRQDRISGSEEWHDMTYEITGSALHTLEWRYVKDESVDREDDCGWVDKVVWTPSP